MKGRACIECGHHFVCKHYRLIQDFLNNFHYQRVTESIYFWGDKLALYCSQYQESK